MRKTRSASPRTFRQRVRRPADAAGTMPEMEEATLDAMQRHAASGLQLLEVALAQLCADVAPFCPSAPGDAIRGAFFPPVAAMSDAREAA